MVELLISQAANGFVWGWILALISIGLTLIFGQMGIINVAHGVLYTLGAVGAYYCFTWLGGWGWSLILSPVFLALLGFILYNATIRFALGREPIVTVIITYGILFILEQSTFLLYGGIPRTVPNPIDYGIPFLGGTYPVYRVFCAAFSFVVIAALMIFLKSTRFGLWIRATKQDYETALNMGIPIRTVYLTTFCLGAALASIGGVLAAPISSVNFNMGNNIIIDAFIVVIMAGFGSIPGTVVAALIIEIVIGISAAFVNPVLAKVIGLGVMLVALFIRPEGIFGED
jgi:branched-chain amino acid transport system permease protein